MEDVMFIYSVRASTVKFFAIIALTLVVVIALLAVGGGGYIPASSSEINFSGMKENDARVEFISQFGVKVKEAPVETESFSVPDNFDRVIAGYNEIQKAQGLDISKYKNKRVTRYTYETVGYEGGESCYVNLIVYRGAVIACDISSTDPEGFVRPLVKL